MPKKAANLNWKTDLKLPSLKKIETEWNLKHFFYTSERDPQIEKDIAKTERAYTAFAKKYQGKNFTKNVPKLLAALKDADTLNKSAAARKPLFYFFFRIELDANDAVAQKRVALIEDRLTKAANQIIFFDLQISKIPVKQQKVFLKDERLSQYHYELKGAFKAAKHLLSEPEEKILSLKSDASHGRWVAGTEKIMNKRSVIYKGEVIPLPSAFDRVGNLPNKEKPKLWSLITDELESLAPIAENELNAVVMNKKVSDELRNYPQPYSATISGYENDEAAVLALVAAIEKRGYKLSREYYRLKAKLSGVKTIPYANRTDEVGKAPKIPFAKAADICRSTFYEISPKYGAIFDKMLQTGAIDVYPKAGKSGGAFCAHSVSLPTMVMLNQINDVRSFTTLAHEMGHAIHSERSKVQPVSYQDYSTTTAETASTFFEGLAQEKLIAELPEAEQLNMLNLKIGEAVATICRQIAFFKFELELHTTIRKEGGMEWCEMADLFKKHMEAYMGPAVEVTRKDGLSFVYVGHFRRFFYVYTYAYGELMSNIMTEKLKENSQYRTDIDRFLTAGSSDTVENIFAAIGINANKIETFMHGLKPLAADVAAFKQLVEKRK